MSLFAALFARLFADEAHPDRELKLGFRGENITYRADGKEIELSFTHMQGPKIFTDTITRWKDGTPLTEEEKATLFVKVLPFVQRNFSGKAIVVINTDDPFRAGWDRLCSEHGGDRMTIEYTSDRDQLQLEREMLAGILRSGKGGLVVDGTKITDEDALNRVLAEMLNKRRQ